MSDVAFVLWAAKTDAASHIAVSIFVVIAILLMTAMATPSDREFQLQRALPTPGTVHALKIIAYSRAEQCRLLLRSLFPNIHRLWMTNSSLRPIQI